MEILSRIRTSILLIFIGIAAFGQPRDGEVKIDGVAAVIGDEIVLDSDIQRDYALQKQRYGDELDLCSFVGNTLLQKIILFHAKSDTLIETSKELIERRAKGIIADFRNRGSDEEILKVYGVRTIPELQQEIEILVKESQMIEKKQALIEEGLDVSPEEVRSFFETYKNDLPQVKEEVEISHIVMYPTLSESHKQEIIAKLKNIKKEIEEGASFATKAILYSEDPGSSSKGGLYENIKRGTFVPEFDAVAFNLEEGEISDPVETEFGFHIIQLEKRLGQAINVRHILLSAKPTADELAETEVLMDSLRSKINRGELTFKEAAKEYSDDKFTRYNGGVMTNPESGEDKFERSKLPTKMVYALAGLSKGDITAPFQNEFERKEAVEMLQLNKVIPAHQISMETDYTRLKNFALMEKKQEKILEWVKQKLPTTFVSINEDYQDCDFELNWLKD